jgi:hypothetical protein
MDEVIDWLTYYNHRRLRRRWAISSDAVREKLVGSTVEGCLMGVKRYGLQGKVNILKRAGKAP